MSCCNNDYLSKNESILIVNKAREAAACAEANCGSSFTNATNAATSATNAANSAAAAATSAAAALVSETNTENLWEQFNALYLGSFATAPTVDNEGNPLQEGALYWNSVSNTMFAWNGSAWATATNFNEFTNFLATGTTTPRNLATRFADVVNVKDFGAVGDGVTDDTAAIQAAIDVAATAGGGVVVFLPETYAIATTVKIKSNITLDLRGATLQRIGTNKTSNIVQNYTYNPSIAIDTNISIINGKIAGNVTNNTSTQDHTAVAGNIFFYGVSIFRIENIRILDANSNGFGWRECSNGLVNKVTGGKFGANLFAPTSGLNNYVTNCDFAYDGATGASPGVCVDIEPNSSTEDAAIYFDNCRINNLVLIDFWRSAGSSFLIEAQFDNCTFVGGSPYTIKISATNSVNANNVIFGDTCRIAVTNSSATALQIGNVNGVICNSQLANDSGAVNVSRGIQTIESVSDFLFKGSTNAGTYSFNNDIESSSYPINNSKFNGVKFNTVYLQGSNNSFESGSINLLTIKGASSIDNIFGVACPVGSVSLVNSALLSNQDFGGDRGTQSKSNFSQSINVPDGATYDLIVPLPNASITTNGRLLFIAAGYSHRGDTNHWAQYLGTIRIGNSSQSQANVISSTGAAGVSIVIQSVTATSVTLRLTYQYNGVFSATILG